MLGSPQSAQFLVMMRALIQTIHMNVADGSK
jgi:hypothetical protein